MRLVPTLRVETPPTHSEAESGLWKFIFALKSGTNVVMDEDLGTDDELTDGFAAATIALAEKGLRPQSTFHIVNGGFEAKCVEDKGE